MILSSSGAALLGVDSPASDKCLASARSLLKQADELLGRMDQAHVAEQLARLREHLDHLKKRTDNTITVAEKRMIFQGSCGRVVREQFSLKRTEVSSPSCGN